MRALQARLPGCQAPCGFVKVQSSHVLQDMTSGKERAERGEIGGIVNREADLQSPFGVTFGFTVGCGRRLRPEAVGVIGERFLSDKLNAARASEFRRLLPVYKGKNLQAGRSTWVRWRHDASASVLMGPPVRRALRLPSTRLILLFSAADDSSQLSFLPLLN